MTNKEVYDLILARATRLQRLYNADLGFPRIQIAHDGGEVFGVFDGEEPLTARELEHLLVQLVNELEES